MYLEFIRLMDGRYLINHEATGPFYGSRLELIAHLSDEGFTDSQIDLILTILDNLKAVKLPANWIGFC
jgi:hypothetical protein